MHDEFNNMLSDITKNAKMFIKDCGVGNGLRVDGCTYEYNSEDESISFELKIRIYPQPIIITMPVLPYWEFRSLSKGDHLKSMPKIKVDGNEYWWIYAIKIVQERLLGKL